MQHPSLAATQTGRRASAVSNGWRLVKHCVLTPALDLIFPPVCVGCGRVGTLLCDRCIASFVAPEETSPPPYPLTALHALGQFNGALQKAVHALKYDCLTDLASPLGSLMAQAILAAGWPRSQIIPVPLHEARYHQRGFNQSALLGQAIARQTGWEQWDEVLARVRMTRSEVGLNYQERKAKGRGAGAVPLCWNARKPCSTLARAASGRSSSDEQGQPIRAEGGVRAHPVSLAGGIRKGASYGGPSFRQKC